MKTSELTGAALDWAVAKCEGMENLRKNPHPFDDKLIMDGPLGNGVCLHLYNPSTNWAQGGPIIEREKLFIVYSKWTEAQPWEAGKNNRQWQGPTPLIAAMRCYVASKLGDEVEIPTELSSN